MNTVARFFKHFGLPIYVVGFMSLLTSACVEAKQTFKVGDCLSSKWLERWEVGGVSRVEEVGKSHYRISLYYPSYQSYFSSRTGDPISLSFTNANEYYTLTVCPKGETN